MLNFGDSHAASYKLDNVDVGWLHLEFAEKLVNGVRELRLDVLPQVLELLARDQGLEVDVIEETLDVKIGLLVGR